MRTRACVFESRDTCARVHCIVFGGGAGLVDCLNYFFFATLYVDSIVERVNGSG